MRQLSSHPAHRSLLSPCPPSPSIVTHSTRYSLVFSVDTFVELSPAWTCPDSLSPCAGAAPSARGPALELRPFPWSGSLGSPLPALPTHPDQEWEPAGLAATCHSELPQLMTFPFPDRNFRKCQKCFHLLGSGREESRDSPRPLGRQGCHTNLGPRAHTQHVGTQETVHACTHTSAHTCAHTLHSSWASGTYTHRCMPIGLLGDEITGRRTDAESLQEGRGRQLDGNLS